MLSLGLINTHHDFLDLGRKWKLAVSVTLLSLYLDGNSSRYPLYRRLGGPQSRSGFYGGKKSYLTSYVDIQIQRPININFTGCFKNIKML
jgi:hypothetical protein